MESKKKYFSDNKSLFSQIKKHSNVNKRNTRNKQNVNCKFNYFLKINNYTSTIESTPSKKAFQSLTQTSLSNAKTNNKENKENKDNTDKVINLFDNSIKGRFHVTL